MSTLYLVWFLLLTIISVKLISGLCDIIDFSFSWLCGIPLNEYTTLYMSSLVLTIMESAAMNILELTFWHHQ